MPHLLQTLVVPVFIDCGLILRVSAATAIWKIDRRLDIVLPFLTWALKDEYWGVAPRAVEVLAEIGCAEVVPDLVLLAERRLRRGPFHFEEYASIAGRETETPFLVLIANALGQCGRGLSHGRSFAPEAKEMLVKLADYGDEPLRKAALTNLQELTAAQRRNAPPNHLEL